MKRIFSILFLLIWVFQSMVSTICFELQKMNNRNLVEQKIKKEKIKHIQYFTYSKNESIYWKYDKKEISRKGKLYDVINCKTQKGIVFIGCISDSTEDLIVSNFQKSKENQKNKKETNNSKKIDLNTNTYLWTNLFIERETIQISAFALKKSNYTDPFQSVSSPPPLV